MILLKTIISFLRDRAYRDLLITTLIILASGTVVYHYVEGWRWLDSLYFTAITLTTIGYGDFAPQTDAGKIFTLFYIVIGLGIILSFINTVFVHYSTIQKDHREKDKHKGKGTRKKVHK